MESPSEESSELPTQQDNTQDSNGDVRNKKTKVKFTVTPVADSYHDALDELPCDETTILQFENELKGQMADTSDTLTHNSITALLSSKFRDIQKRLKQYGIEAPKFRKRLVSKWESLNYDICENVLYIKNRDQYRSKIHHEFGGRGVKRWVTFGWLSKWMIMLGIGLLTALLAAAIHGIVEEVAHIKFKYLSDYFDQCAKDDCLYLPVFMWMGMNLVITCLASLLVTFLNQKAAGSGIPLIKAYLNGVKIPGLLSFKCFIAKSVGVVLSILGGLFCGKEGPMAHSGGIIAAGLGKGRIRLCKGKGISLYDGFRNDHEIRDFVAGGAAAGVSAAFGAPVGGTLFSLEEAASFWNQDLTWRVFFGAMISTFFTNFLLGAFHGHATELSSPGLVRFNVFDNDLKFDLIEIPVFVVMAVVGGVLGASFVVLNYKLTVFRQRFLRNNWLKVIEAGVVAMVSALLAFILMVVVDDCTATKPFGNNTVTARMHCKPGEHHGLSNLFLNTPEGCLKSLLHDPYESHSPASLAVFTVVLYFLSVWTYGLSVSSGVFIPSLATGAAWGRLVGMGVVDMLPGLTHLSGDFGKYALIGAASQIGGNLRTTISLTVIIVECTGDISFGLPIIIVLMISKWVGDFITTGLYDMNIEVLGIPIIPFEAPPLVDDIRASEVMTSPLIGFRPKEKVGQIIDILKTENMCGFPITETPEDEPGRIKLKGLILREQLIVILKKKIFAPEGLPQPKNITIADFRNFYPLYLKIKDIAISEEERDYMIDLRPFYNPTPHTIEKTFSLPKVFNVFRGLGLRHLIVTDDKLTPLGMITRKDLAKFRAGTKRGLVKIEHLKIEDN
ncbi:H(+)/Cl(-) exchange transporter 7-like isoform X3 [Mytilus edulis]|uniref:H(+)/Cl(-) exchange transporter 7-like isoform X3 n=1 Tax=Mytilus edulis TaxID=6550 RepID=UPI0039EEF20B